MAVLVLLLGVVLALLTVLVAGLLRSHAEILRALHELGVNLDPQQAGSVSGASAAVRAPVVRATEVRSRPSRAAVDIAGTTPERDAVSIAVAGAPHLTLLAFLSSGCGTCSGFWDAFDDADIEVPGEARLIIVTKSPSAESLAGIRRLAPSAVPVVMSDDAWRAYDVPVAPFFVLVDGPSESVIGEGAASNWQQVMSLLHSALGDAGLLDRQGRVKQGVRPRLNAEAVREARADRDLFAAGIMPGDPSLYKVPPAEPVNEDDPEVGS
jgi:hypothetical protein